MPVRAGGAENRTTGGGGEGGTVDGVAAHRCRRAVRVSLPAGRMGESLPVRGVALREEAKEVERTRAIPVVRHAGIQLSSIRYQPRLPDRRGGRVLSATGGSGEFDQGSQQRCGLGGTSIRAMGDELRALPVGDA